MDLPQPVRLLHCTPLSTARTLPALPPIGSPPTSRCSHPRCLRCLRLHASCAHPHGNRLATCPPRALRSYSCETWRAGSWPDDPPGVDRSYCWTWIDQIYYAVITFCTIGFGDVTPHSKAGKLLGAVLVAFGVFCFTTLLAVCAARAAPHGRRPTPSSRAPPRQSHCPRPRPRRLRRMLVVSQELVEFKNSQRLGADKTLAQRLEELREVILQDNDGTVSPEEYIIFNLKKMGKVDDELLLLLRDQFNTLDADGSGELDESDINMLSSAAAKVEAVKREQQRLAPAA